VIERGALPEVEREHTVISTKLLAGRTVVHVHRDTSPAPARTYRNRQQHRQHRGLLTNTTGLGPWLPLFDLLNGAVPVSVLYAAWK
jgi:hypothetical protein